MKKKFSKEINLLIEKFLMGDLDQEESVRLGKFLNSTPDLNEELRFLSFMDQRLDEFAKRFPNKASRIDKDKTVIPPSAKNNVTFLSSVKKIRSKLPSFNSQTILWPAAMAVIALFFVGLYRINDVFFESKMNSKVTSVEGTCDTPGVSMKVGDSANGRVIYSGANSFCEIAFKGKYTVNIKLFSQTVIKSTIRGNALDISLASGEMMVEADSLPNPDDFTVFVKGHALRLYGSKVYISANDSSVDFDVIQGTVKVKSNLYLMERMGSQLSDADRELLKSKFPETFSETEKLLTIGKNFNSAVDRSSVAMKTELFEQVEDILIYEKDSTQNREIAMGSLEKVQDTLKTAGQAVAENISQEPTPNKFKDLSRIAKKSDPSEEGFSITFKLTLKNGELFLGAVKEQKESYFVSTNQGTKEFRKSDVKRIDFP